MQRLSPRFSNFSYGRSAEKRFSQIYRDLYGDAMLVPTCMGTNMRTETIKNICDRVLVQKRGFIPRGTHKH